MTPADRQAYAVMTNEDKIKFSRRVALSAHCLTLNETRLIYLAVRNLDPFITVGQYAESEGTTVTSADFREVYGLSQKAATISMKVAVEHLYERSIKFTRHDDAKDHVRWLCRRTAYKNGAVTLKFNPDLILDLVGMQSECYTLMSVGIIGKLTNLQAINLYRVLKTHEFTSYQIIKIEDLHHDLGSTPSSIKDFNTFRKDVLAPSLADINAKTDMKVSYTTTRGRANKVVSVNFTFGGVEPIVGTQTVTATESRPAKQDAGFEAAMKMLHKVKADAIQAATDHIPF